MAKNDNFLDFNEHFSLIEYFRSNNEHELANEISEWYDERHEEIRKEIVEKIIERKKQNE